MSILKTNISLKDYSNYKIGGEAKFLLEAKNEDDIKEGVLLFRKDNPNGKIFILGKGTNILIDDNGFDGLVIISSLKGISEDNGQLSVSSGETIEDINEFCIDKSLSGLEWSGGLPGTIGGAVRGNAGAFGGEIKDNVQSVTSMDLSTFEIRKRTNKDCDFSYRNSIFKKTEGENEIILNVTLSLIMGEKEKIDEETLSKINYRKERHPLEYPNIGSIFKNVDFKDVPDDLKDEMTQYIKNDPFPVVPSAKLIFLAGLKGERIGDAQISEKHTNFIVNLGNAKSSDVLELIELVKKTIMEKYQIEIEQEVMYLR